MPDARLRTRIAIALALIAGGMSQAAAAPPRPAPPPAPPDEHSYSAALRGLGNYHSCGFRVAAADYVALTAQLGAIEAAARAKGLGPTLDRVRQQYQAILAVSILLPCAGGAIAALERARRTMAAFQAWVAGAPAVALTPAEQEAEIVRTIVALEDAYDAAEMARGDAALRRALDEHFVHLRKDESPADRLAFLDAAARAAVHHEAVTERHVAVQGDGATVTGIVTIAYAAPSDVPPSRFRFTETIESSNGIWRLVARHLADRPLP